MKVAITCDELIQKSFAQEVVASLIGLFDEVEIFTISHQVGHISAFLEQKKIHSTFLGRKINQLNQWNQWSFLIPSAAKNLHIPCSFDLIINVSTGYSHGISHCQDTPVITYLIETENTNKIGRSSFISKIFGPYLNQWSNRKLIDSDLIWAATSYIESSVKKFGKKVEIIPPPFKLEDFPIINQSQITFEYFLIATDGLEVKDAEILLQFFKKHKVKFKFIGNDDHLKSLKDKGNDFNFFGNRCSGELAPLISGAKAVIDYSPHIFSKNKLATLAAGRPLIVRDLPEIRSEYNYNGVLFYKSNKDLVSLLLQLFNQNIEFVSADLRSHVKKHNEIVFKKKISKKVDQFIAASGL